MNNGVTNRQLFFIIIVSMMGFSAVEIPKIMVEAAGTGAWFSLLIGAVFFALDVLMLVYLGEVYKGKSLFEYSQLLIGKIGSGVFCVIYILYFFILLTFVVRTSADIIKAEILYKTPLWSTMLLLLSVSLFAASKGVTHLARISEFLGLIVLIVGFILQFTTFTQGNLLNMLPLFESEEIGRYFRALPSTIFCFLGFEVITIIPFTKRNNKNSFWAAPAAVLLLCLYFIIIILSCGSVLGVDDIIHYDYPLLTAIRRLDIASLDFAKRLDLFFIMAWLTSTFCLTSMLSYTTAAYTKKIFPKLNRHILLIVIGLLAFATGSIIQNAEDFSRLFFRFTTHIGLFPAFAIPFILFLVHLCRAKSKRLPKDEDLNGGDLHE